MTLTPEGSERNRRGNDSSLSGVAASMVRLCEHPAVVGQQNAIAVESQAV